MVKITVTIYYFFKRHKTVFWSLLLCTTLFFGFFASKIEFEEDISKLLPSAEKGGAEELVFSNLKVKDKIFILFNPKSDNITSDDLIDICDEFVETLIKKDTELKSIDNILYQLDEDIFHDAISFLYESTPAYLTESDYEELEKLLEKSRIEEQMAENYAVLRSPSGGAYKEIIMQDPIGLRNIFLAGLSDMANGLGGNYKLYENHFFTPDTTVAIAFLSPNFKSFDSGKGTQLSKMIEDEIKIFQEANPDIEILYHGAPVQSVYNSKRIKLDLLLTISISLVLIVVLLLVCFKNKSNILYLILPVIYGVILALAIIYFIKGSMSLMAMGIGAIVMGVAFSYCLHVITHFKYVNDTVKVLKDETNAVIIGTLTTIGAFMGLLLTKSELLRDFGLFASLGLVSTTIFSLIFLPQFFNRKNNRKSEKAFALLEKINSYPYEKQRWLIVSIILISVVCFIASDYVKFDSDLQNIGYNNPRVIKSRNLLASKTTGTNSTVYFSAIAEDIDTALENADRLTIKLNEMVSTGQIDAYSAPFRLFIPTDEQEIRIKSWNNFWTQEKKEDVFKKVNEYGRQYKFNENTFIPFVEMLNADYKPVSLYNAGIIPKGLLENMIEYNGEQYMIFIPVQMDRQFLSDIGDEIVNADPHFLVIDPMYYTNDMVKAIHKDFNITLAISSLFVLIVLLISYRSIIIALIAFLPMFLSWYIVTGCMAIFGIEFNLINIVISTFIFGIGVDYSIFIMDGLLAVYRTKKPLLLHHKTAIFLSALILIIVITSLMFAVHPAISSIGVSTLIGMIGTLLISYTLLPFLFSVVINNRIRKGKDPVSVYNLLRPKKKQNFAQQIKNNYLYKGNTVEFDLNKELISTSNYALLSVLCKDKNSLLEYGCEYGYCSYWASITNHQLEITGIDEKEYHITLADNCYRKTKSLQFTTQADELKSRYDIIILNHDENILGKEALTALIKHAKTIIIRKSITDKYIDLIDTKKFNVKEEDYLFTAYSII